MSKYVLSAEDHADMLSSVARFEKCFSDKQARLEAAGYMTIEDHADLSRDRARLELVRQHVAHLASGHATNDDAQRYSEIMIVQIHEMREETKRLERKRQFLEGVVALHQLGLGEDEIVTVN